MKFNWDFVKKILIRALHTAAQTALGMFTIGTTIKEVDWLNILSVSAVAAVYSILKSIAVGIPEAGIIDGSMIIDNNDPEDPKVDIDLGELNFNDMIGKKALKLSVSEGKVTFDDEEEIQNGSEE